MAASLPAEEKIRIDHLGAQLVGILARPAHEVAWARGDPLRPIALIQHGQLAHKVRFDQCWRAPRGQMTDRRLPLPKPPPS